MMPILQSASKRDCGRSWVGLGRVSEPSPAALIAPRIALLPSLNALTVRCGIVWYGHRGALWIPGRSNGSSPACWELLLEDPGETLGTGVAGPAPLRNIEGVTPLSAQMRFREVGR